MATNTTTGAGLIQSLGIGSGLNVQSLVTQLVAADRAPVQARLTRQAQSIATQVSALGTLKGALASFQSALTPFTTADGFQSKSATSADPTVFGVTAGNGAVAGSYNVEVRQLAQPEQLISKPIAAGAAVPVGTGTLHLTLGSNAFDVSISAPANTLADVRNAINGASGNPGVRATLVYGVGGAQLVLTSAQTGATNAIRITASGGDGGLAQFSYSGALDTHYTETQLPQDAIAVISGVEAHSSNNVIDKALDGVALSLKTAKPGTTFNMTIADAQRAVTANVQTLVAAYNSMQSQVSGLGKYDAATKTGGPLLGDFLLNSVQFQLTRGMTDQVAALSGSYTALANLGITTGSDGALSVDATKLQAALTADAGSAARLFSGSNGIAARLNTALTGLLSSAGAIAARDTNLTTAQADVTNQGTRLDAQMAVVQQRYLTQFNALDSLMSQLNSTSNYLTQQLSSIAKIGSTSSTG